MSKLNWAELKKEFMLCNLSLSQFAAQKGLTLSGNFKKHTKGWADEREQFRHDKGTKTLNKVIERAANKEADLACKELEAAELLLDIILKEIKQPDNLNKHIIKLRTGTDPGVFKDRLITKKLDVVDTKRLIDLSNALSKNSDTKRKWMGMIDPEAKEKLAIDRERLELEKVKAKLPGSGEEAEETGVVFIPERRPIQEDDDNE